MKYNIKIEDVTDEIVFLGCDLGAMKLIARYYVHDSVGKYFLSPIIDKKLSYKCGFWRYILAIKFIDRAYTDVSLPEFLYYLTGAIDEYIVTSEDNSDGHITRIAWKDTDDAIVITASNAPSSSISIKSKYKKEERNVDIANFDPHVSGENSKCMVDGIERIFKCSKLTTFK